MTDQQMKYLINLTNAYNTTCDGDLGTRRIYSVNMHGLLSRKIGGGTVLFTRVSRLCLR